MKLTKRVQIPSSPLQAGSFEKVSPDTPPLHRGARASNSPRSTSYYKLGLFACFLICMIILASIDASEAKKSPRKSRKKSMSDNDVTVDEPVRRRKRPGRGKRILKTSEEARIVTEKRYLKSDWCKIRPLKQVVQTRNGCKGNFINNFCYGQCNSFYIPKELTGEEREQEAFKSCSFCKPFKVERVSVTLTCPGRRHRQRRTIKRMVNRIKECRCIAVPDIDPRTPAPEEAVSTSAISSVTTTGESRR